jgi:hypothetical protein
MSCIPVQSSEADGQQFFPELPLVLVVARAGHEIVNFLEITGNGMPLVFASWTVPRVFRIARFHYSFGYVLTLVYCGLKLITAINFFDVGHVFLSLGCNKSNDLTVLPIWLAWLLDWDLKI